MLLVRAARLEEAQEVGRGALAGLDRGVLEVHRLLGRHLPELDLGGHERDRVLLPLRLVLPVVAQLLDGGDRLAEVLGAEIRVLLGAALLGGDVDHEPVSVDRDRHLGHLLVVEELVERVARLGVGLALVERLGLPDVRPRDGDERVRAGLLLGLLERLVREVPALGLDERLSGVHELPGRVRAVRAEHLGVYLGALLPEAHLDERLRELRLRVLRLAGLGELLGEAVQRVLGLRYAS